MLLTFEKIKELTVGAVEITESDGELRFYKYTQEQRAAWELHGKFLADNARGSTGVRLDFHTNSRNVSFSLGGEGKFEIYVNGVFRYGIKASQTPDFSFALEDSLGAPLPQARVTVFFPSHGTGGTLRSIDLDDGAYATRHVFDNKILFMGDSITQGWASSYDTLSFAYRVSRHFNAESVIQGVGGAGFFADILSELPFEPDEIFVAYGTNDFDFRKSPQELVNAVRNFMVRLRELYADKSVYVISPIWRVLCDEKAVGSFADCRKIIADEAEKQGFVHIDGLLLVPPNETLFVDGLHPNDNGFSVYAENLIIELGHKRKK